MAAFDARGRGENGSRESLLVPCLRGSSSLQAQVLLLLTRSLHGTELDMAALGRMAAGVDVHVAVGGGDPRADGLARRAVPGIGRLARTADAVRWCHQRGSESRRRPRHLGEDAGGDCNEERY